MGIAIETRLPLFLGISVVVLGFAACATLSPREQEVQVAPSVLSNYLADKPEALREHYSMVMVQGPRNEVLNQMRSGLAAYELGAMPVATESFDRALRREEKIQEKVDYIIQNPVRAGLVNSALKYPWIWVAKV